MFGSITVTLVSAVQLCYFYLITAFHGAAEANLPMLRVAVILETGHRTEHPVTAVAGELSLFCRFIIDGAAVGWRQFDDTPLFCSSWQVNGLRCWWIEAEEI